MQIISKHQKKTEGEEVSSRWTLELRGRDREIDKLMEERRKSNQLKIAPGSIYRLRVECTITNEGHALESEIRLLVDKTKDKWTLLWRDTSKHDYEGEKCRGSLTFYYLPCPTDIIADLINRYAEQLAKKLFHRRAKDPDVFPREDEEDGLPSMPEPGDFLNIDEQEDHELLPFQIEREGDDG